MTDYREVAKQLDAKYLFGRWGVSFHAGIPGNGRHWRLKIVPLDGWITDPHEIIEALANDDAFSIRYADDKVTDMAATGRSSQDKRANPPEKGVSKL